MKTIIKNVVCILILINTINLFSQKRKQDIVYEEPSRFIQSPLAIGKAATSQVPGIIIQDKNQNSFLHKSNLSKVEKEESDSVLINKWIKLMIHQKSSLEIAALKGEIEAGILIYKKDDVSVIILTNVQDFRPEDYLQEIANLNIKEIK